MSENTRRNRFSYAERPDTVRPACASFSLPLCGPGTAHPDWEPALRPKSGHAMDIRMLVWFVTHDTRTSSCRPSVTLTCYWGNPENSTRTTQSQWSINTVIASVIGVLFLLLPASAAACYTVHTRGSSSLNRSQLILKPNHCITCL